jgi:hypothetical protein
MDSREIYPNFFIIVSETKSIPDPFKNKIKLKTSACRKIHGEETADKVSHLSRSPPKQASNIASLLSSFELEIKLNRLEVS